MAGSIAKTRVVRLAALAPLILLHVAGLILLVVTERSFIGAGVFLLAWITLNCLGLALVRRPTISALISLEILLALTVLSRFKFEKLWMTDGYFYGYQEGAEARRFNRMLVDGRLIKR